MNVASGRRDQGFSLIEIMIALLITMIVMASVMMLLTRGQKSFQREPEVADMTANSRAGLDRIGQDLALAGFRTPANMAIMWFDGGGITPDELTIVYADPDIPISRPMGCSTNPGGGGGGGPAGGGGACNTIGRSAVLNIDPYSFDPMPANMEEETYDNGQVLFAIQGPNGDPACDNMAPSIIPFELTQDPKCTNAGGADDASTCGTLNINHNPAGSTDLNVPQGFDNQVSVNCAVIGVFHVVQYRVNPLPPAENPALERRDLALGAVWTPLSANIENLQVQYSQGGNDVFNDVPPLIPIGNNPNSFITAVRVSVSGRSESTNLEGATQGVFAANDTHLRRGFTTTVSLRNQLSHVQQKSFSLGLDGWN